MPPVAQSLAGSHSFHHGDTAPAPLCTAGGQAGRVRVPRDTPWDVGLCQVGDWPFVLVPALLAACPSTCSQTWCPLPGLRWALGRPAGKQQGLAMPLLPAGLVFGAMAQPACVSRLTARHGIGIWSLLATGLHILQECKGVRYKPLCSVGTGCWDLPVQLP